MPLLHLLEDVPEKLELQEKTLEVERVSKVEILPRKAAGHKQTWARKEVTWAAACKDAGSRTTPSCQAWNCNAERFPCRVCLAISFLSMSACILPEKGKPTLGHCTGNPLE